MSVDQPDVPEADALEQQTTVVDDLGETDRAPGDLGGDPRDRTSDLLDPVDPADAADQARVVGDPYDEER